VDDVEIVRRMSEGIFDEEEFVRALAWTKEKCKEGFDKNPVEIRKSVDEKDRDWEFVVKMMMVIKDLMCGNPKLPEGREEEMVGHNAIAAGLSTGLLANQSRDYAADPEKAKRTTGKMRAKDRPLANDYISDEEFDRLLDAWFGNIVHVLDAGRTAYIWGGYANLPN
jgi:hypothetical protein